jgi:transposase
MRRQRNRIDRRPLERRLPDIRDHLFRSGDFFDPEDVAQVKYEMLRRHRVDGLGVTEVAALFGVSRQTVYNIARDFDEHGMLGLSSGKPREKPGPRGGWKCTREVVAFAARRRRQRPDVGLTELAREIERRFQITITAGALRYALTSSAQPSSPTRPSRRPSS